MQDQKNLSDDGLELTAVARISSGAHGSMVSGTLISRFGGTRALGATHNADAEEAAEIWFFDFNPAFSSIAMGLPGTTVAEAPNSISRTQSDCHTHFVLVPKEFTNFVSNKYEQLA